MGLWYTLKCTSCKKEFGAMLGIGIRYPITYEELLEDIRNEKYGKEWKELIKEDENLVFDAFLYLYTIALIVKHG